MDLIDYTPFAKTFDELTIADLSTLRSVNEGWYVEYKREVAKPQAIAKSISALANTRGGWLFYGVDAPSGSIGGATGFPGLASRDVPTELTRIRDAVTAWLSPVPYFEAKTLDGPNVDLALPPDRSIIIIHVPAGSRPPYVHSSGVIYARVSDKSDPVGESDRSRLAALFERGRDSENKLIARLRHRPTTVDGGLPTLHMSILIDPYDERRWRHTLKFEQFATLMNPIQQSINGTVPSWNLSLPFPCVQTATQAFIARQQGPGIMNKLTWRFNRRGESAITLPLPFTAVDSVLSLQEYLRGYEHSNDFVEQWRQANPGSVRVIDLCILGPVFVGIFSRFRELLMACNFKDHSGTAVIRMELHNVGSTVPFVDVAPFIDHIRTFGLPVVQEDHMKLPGDEINDFSQLVPWESADMERIAGQSGSHGLFDSLVSLLLLANGFGLPWFDGLDSLEGKISGPLEGVIGWLTSIERPLKVQALRNERSRGLDLEAGRKIAP